MSSLKSALSLMRRAGEAIEQKLAGHPGRKLKAPGGTIPADKLNASNDE